MVEFKVVISDPKTGKSYQQEIKDENARAFLNKKIGDKIKGEAIDMTGYEFEIKGGSDSSGFPMRRDVDGQGRKKIFAVSGVGMKEKITFTKKGDRKIRRKRDGVKQRKTVCGNTIHDEISQINLMVLKQGSKPLGGEETPAENADASAEAAPVEKKVEEKKEEPKEEKVENKPAEEKPADKATEEKVEEKKEAEAPAENKDGTSE
jgi:small subunit ribosomal protein S6e